MTFNVKNQEQQQINQKESENKEVKQQLSKKLESKNVPAIQKSEKKSLKKVRLIEPKVRIDLTKQYS